jgi:hypothetical protein
MWHMTTGLATSQHRLVGNELISYPMNGPQPLTTTTEERTEML